MKSFNYVPTFPCVLSGSLISRLSDISGLQTILFSCDIIESGPLRNYLFLQLDLLNLVIWCDTNSTFYLLTSVSTDFEM